MGHVASQVKIAGFLGTFLPLASRVGLLVHLGMRELRFINSVLFFSKEDIIAFVDQNTLQRHIKPFSSTPTTYSLYVCVHRSIPNAEIFRKATKTVGIYIEANHHLLS